MNPPGHEILNSLPIQYGFASLCFIMLLIIAWMFRAMRDALVSTQKVISEHTAAMDRLMAVLSDREREIAERMEFLEKRLLTRPCIMYREEGVPFPKEIVTHEHPK